MSSPSCVTERSRDRESSTGVSTTSATSTGTTCGQLVPLRLPVSQRSASCRSHCAAPDSTYAVRLSSIAATPIPTSTSRVPATPPFFDSR